MKSKEALIELNSGDCGSLHNSIPSGYHTPLVSKTTPASIIADGSAFLNKLLELHKLEGVSQLLNKVSSEVRRDGKPESMFHSSGIYSTYENGRSVTNGDGDKWRTCEESVRDEDLVTKYGKNIKSKNTVVRENSKNSGKTAAVKDTPSRRVSFKVRSVANAYKGSVRRNKFIEVKSSSVAKLASKFNSLAPDSPSKNTNGKKTTRVKNVESFRNSKNVTPKRSALTKKESLTAETSPKKSACHKQSIKDDEVTNIKLAKAIQRGSVKAAIEIFENTAKLNSKLNDSVTLTSILKSPSRQEKNTPKYCKVVFKTVPRLVSVDCGDIDKPDTPPNPELKPTISNDCDRYTFRKVELVSSDDTDEDASNDKDNSREGVKNISDQRYSDSVSVDDCEQKKNEDSCNNVERDESVRSNNGDRSSPVKPEASSVARRDGECSDTSVTDKNSVLSLKPNTSFLWGLPNANTKCDQMFGKCNQGFVEDENYDDIYSFRKPSLDDCPYIDDGTYDDVGFPDYKNGYEYCGAHDDYDDCEGEGYQCIDESNIYDDVKSLGTVTTISNCYESIYSLKDDKRECSSSPAPSTTASRCESFCDQTNSLYGTGSRFDSSSVSQVSTLSADEGPHEVLSYQLTSLERPGSEASDEWVDLDGSDNEYTVSGFPLPRPPDKLKIRRSPNWSRRVRRQWSKSRRRQGSRDCSSGSDSDHHYEMLDDVIKNNNVDHNLDDDFDDSFDSEFDDCDSTYMKSHTQCDYNGALPNPPASQNIYGITRIAEAAGKKMQMFRKSLSKMRTKRSSEDIDSVPDKGSSLGNLSGRKYWSLRKFKRSLSATSPISSASSTTSKRETATFYLSPSVDLGCGTVDDSYRRCSDVYSETSDVTTSPSSYGSTTTLVKDNTPEDEKNTANKKRVHIERPHSPPPLPPTSPPVAPKRAPRKAKKSGNTSWYAECGLFTQNDTKKGTPRSGGVKLDKPHSWYAEVGLWGDTAVVEQDASVSSDTSNCSTTATTNNQDIKSTLEKRFSYEPLYQFYTASVAKMAQRDIGTDLDSDGYEEICDGMLKASSPSRPTAMQLIQPHEGIHRTLWCEIPEVISSEILSSITTQQKKLQEAKFEIISSEASYINSLNVLEKHFMSSQELCDESVLSRNDRRTLFSNVLPVKSCSSKFLADLESCWQDSIMLLGICDIIYKHATSNFSVYVKYCSNQIYLDRTLRRLKEHHGKFAHALSELESSAECQSLSLHSFLMLPMQRITRLPLLVDAVLTRLSPQDEEYSECQLALATLNKIVQECNEGARRMERMEEILILNRQLEFSREVKAVPIISSTRWLIKRGELAHLVWREEGKLTFGKKFSKVILYLFLFTDMLIITKKKSDECYVVTDYCPRNLVHVAAADDIPHLPVKFTSDGSKHLMLLTMLQNHDKKTVEMVLSCPMESDRQRWLEALSPPTTCTPGESVYPEWDTPQVTAVHSYTASQPDELSLDVSDVINVLRKMPDGWYQGERIRDREVGWFPGNYTIEIASAHVKARNLKQRYRLLALSGNYLNSQLREKNTK